MIKQMNIHAFKSIKNLSLPCSSFNLFVGTNSSGKSSCLQALLLFEQNRYIKNGLNGQYVSLGEFREVRNNYMPRESIRIEVNSINNEGKDVREWVEFSEEDNSYEIDGQFQTESSVELKQQKGYRETPQKFHYLSCHRIGAMDIYQKNLDKYSTFGNDGEFALAYLLEHGPDSIDEDLRVDDEEVPGDLLGQVNYWLKYIIGTELSVKEIQKTNYLQVTYNNNPANSALDAMYRRPINIGSGVSYLISIIITCLGSKNGAVVVLENPEIHLHPKAQSKLCELLYFVAQRGRQLFVETHSDHIFNGLRVGLACKDWEPSLINVNFLAVDENYETVCNPITFGPYGKIHGENPDMDLNDLFDQFEIDLDKMLGLE